VTYHLIFIHMASNTFILLYKTSIRPHLDYANSVWHPHKVGDIEDSKNAKRATTSVATLKKLPYKKRLEHLDLVTLKYTRLRRGMLEVYLFHISSKSSIL